MKATIKMISAALLVLGCANASHNIEGEIYNQGRIDAAEPTTLTGDGTVVNFISFAQNGTDENQYDYSVPFISDKISWDTGTGKIVTRVADLGDVVRGQEALNSEEITFNLTFPEAETGNAVEKPEFVSLSGEDDEDELMFHSTLMGETDVQILKSVAFDGNNSGYKGTITIKDSAKAKINSTNGLFGGNITVGNSGELDISGVGSPSLKSGISWDFKAGGVLTNTETEKEIIINGGELIL